MTKREKVSDDIEAAVVDAFRRAGHEGGVNFIYHCENCLSPKDGPDLPCWCGHTFGDPITAGTSGE